MGPSLGRTLILLGGLLILAGIVVLFLPRVPWLGRLPGDIRIERPRVKIYAPLATSLIVSLILTLLLNLFFRRR
jgi:hypothetical protein